MTYKITTNFNKKSINIGQDVRFNVNVTWDVADTPITETSVMKLEIASGVTGTVKLDDQAPPVNITPYEVNTKSRTAQFRTSVTGVTAGDCKVTASVTTPTVAAATSSVFFILPDDIKYETSGFDKRIMLVADVDTLTPATATDDQKATIVVTAKKADDTPVQSAEINFVMRNGNLSSGVQGGLFFDGNNNALTGKFEQSTATYTVTTDATGTATLIVVANTQAAYLDCSINGGSSYIVSSALYLYDKTNQGLPAPTPELERNLDGKFDITSHTGSTFLVRIPATISMGERAALILNDKYEIELLGPANSSSPSFREAKLADLIAGINPTSENELFYTVTLAGTLQNSQRAKFTVINNGPTPPQTTTTVVGPLTKPEHAGGVINNDTLKFPFDFVIPLTNDEAVLATNNVSPLTTADFACLVLKLQGDDPDGKFQQNSSEYPLAITDLTAATLTITVPKSVFWDYGTPKDTSKRATYSYHYEYRKGSATGTVIAASTEVSGPINTLLP